MTRAEVRVLEIWARGAVVPAAVAERARIVLACAGGTPRCEVARAFATSAHRVGRWCRRFATDGLDGLLDRVRPGARSRVDGDLRDHVVRCIAGGEASTHGLARACGISQPTASRLRRELALDPTTAPLLPSALRPFHPEGFRLVGLYVAAGHVVVVVRPWAVPALPSAVTLLESFELHAPRDAARRARKHASLKLRRFLRTALRHHPGPLHALVHALGRPGPAVRRLLEKNPRLGWHPLDTRQSFTRVLAGWIAVDGGRAGSDPAFAAACAAGAALAWVAPCD